MPKSKRKRYHRIGRQNKPGCIGVKKRPSGKYRASMTINGKLKYLGSYDTAEQAAKVYDKEAIRLGRPFSSLNYPKKAPVGYTPVQKALSSNNTVGYRGVSQRREKNGGKFRASITNNGKSDNIGTYDTAKEAAIAFDRAILKANKSTALLNFPDMVHNLDVEPKGNKRKSSTGWQITGYKGVSNGKNGKFAARFTSNGKNLNIGTFATAIQAALAYDQAAIKAGRKKSTLNFPDGFVPIFTEGKQARIFPPHP